MKKKAKSKTPKKPAEKPITQQILAPYSFTPDEISKMDRDLRGHLTAIDELKNQAKQSAADFKLRITGHDNHVKQLRNKLDSGSETRPTEAIATFDAKRGKKSFTHPTTGEFIREEGMSPADYQLPMFKTEEVQSVKPLTPPNGEREPPAKPTTKKAAAPKSSPAGATNLGDKLDRAAAATNAPPIVLDCEKKDWQHDALTREFKKAAKAAGWSKPQESVVLDRLRECASEDAMIDVLRPFTLPAPVAETQSTDPTGL